MKKIATLFTLLMACNNSSPNVAELRVKSDVTGAKCASGMLSDGTSVTKCVVPRDDGKGTVTVIGAQGGEYPFQVWTYKTSAQFKDERKAQEAAPAATPDAGAGSGSKSK